MVYGRLSVPTVILLSDSQQPPTQTVPRHAPTLPIPRDSGGMTGLTPLSHPHMTLANQLPMLVLTPATMGETSSHRYFWVVGLVPPMRSRMDTGHAEFMSPSSVLSPFSGCYVGLSSPYVPRTVLTHRLSALPIHGEYLSYTRPVLSSQEKAARGGRL